MWPGSVRPPDEDCVLADDPWRHLLVVLPYGFLCHTSVKNFHHEMFMHAVNIMAGTPFNCPADAASSLILLKSPLDFSVSACTQILAEKVKLFA